MTEVVQDPLLTPTASERGLNLAAQPDEDDVEPLNHEEIEEARSRILGLHPYVKAKLTKLFPMLGCCFCDCCFSCCKKDEAEMIEKMKETKRFEREQEHKNLMNVFNKFGVQYTGVGPKELHNPVDLVTSPEDDDPLKGLGFGFEAYWRMLFSLSGIFLLLSIIFLPELIMNIAVGGMKGIRNYADSQFTLGNLGFSASNCISSYQEISNSNPNRDVSCLVGKISNLTYFGLIPNATESPDGIYNLSNYADHTTNSWYAYCGDPNTPNSNVPYVDTCSQLIDYEELNATFFTDCYGQKNCSVNFGQFISSYITQHQILNKTTYDFCTTGAAKWYAQYTCLQDDKELDGKRYMGLAIVCLGFFGIACYSLQVFYLTHTAKLDFRLWDISTLTAADFTAEITITAEMWENHFLGMSQIQEMRPTQAAPSMEEMRTPVTALYQFLENEIVRRLRKLPVVIKEEEIKIAHISFAYDNKKMIALLLDRGTIIAKGNFKKLAAINQKIDDLMTNEKEKIERPVAAFITFETQEAFERGAYYFPHHNDQVNRAFDWVDPVPEEDKKLLGHKLMLARATEPANILWENRHTTKKEIIMRTIIVGIAIIIVLALSLGLFIVMMGLTSVNQLKYPPAMACDDIDAMFYNNYTSGGAYEKWAYVDKNFTEAEQGVGIYQCYCMQEYSSVRGKDSLCYRYDADLLAGYTTTEVMTVAITLINMIIRDISIVLIEYIGYHTETEQTAAIMSLITVATFFNTAILMLLTNANTEGTLLSWIPLRGTMTDLDLNWYTDIGDALVWTMLINSVYVYLGFVMQAAMMIVFRSLDKGCKNFWSCAETDQTKCKTIQQYVNTYAGPVHLMHFKYATAMNTIYTCFMYGLALPVMFPIGFLTFFNIYLVEKLCVAYWYQKPPMYGPELNSAALDMMRWAPLAYFVFGYWIMGNKQIFNNTAVTVEFNNVPVPTDHNGWPWNENGPAVPMFFFLCAFLVVMCGKKYIAMCLKKCNLTQDTDEIEVDEQLGNYFETLPNHSRMNWFATEINNAQRLGIKTFGAGAHEQLRTVHGKTKTMKNCISYNILQNPAYMTLFQYVPMTQRDNLEESTTSDMVTSALYSAQRKEGFQAGGGFANSGSAAALRKSLHRVTRPMPQADPMMQQQQMY